MKHISFITMSAAFALTLSGCALDGINTTKSSTSAKTQYAQTQDRKLPALVVTDAPPPDVIYRRGSRDTVLSSEIPASIQRADTTNVETLVTRKVSELDRDLTNLDRATADAHERLTSLQIKNDAAAAKYYEVIASINTELQAGTTPGNPILVERWNVAQDRLQALAQTAGYLNGLATDLSDEASKAGFLQDNVRAAYGLSGAVREDHEKLRALEDRVNQNIVAINRQLTSVSDEINRRSSYLRSETLNLQTLSLAIARGELYGQNLTNSLFKKATSDNQEIFKEGSAPEPSVAGRRPLVIIRFDRANVNYEQALYSAVGQTLEKYPAAKFDLVAVSASEGNPAQTALASTEARKNGEAVLRSLNNMGLPMERVNLGAATSSNVRNSEVHIFLQ